MLFFNDFSIVKSFPSFPFLRIVRDQWNCERVGIEAGQRCHLCCYAGAEFVVQKTAASPFFDCLRLNLFLPFILRLLTLSPSPPSSSAIPFLSFLRRWRPPLKGTLTPSIWSPRPSVELGLEMVDEMSLRVRAESPEYELFRDDWDIAKSRACASDCIHSSVEKMLPAGSDVDTFGSSKTR